MSQPKHPEAAPQALAKVERAAPRQAHATSTAARSAQPCPACGFALEGAPRFCPDCGADLVPARACPSCHAAVGPDGDFCERCGAWLLGGRCRFCYSPLAEGHPFCPECGNSSAGVQCPHCGGVGFFDYCATCQRPLTEAAHALEQQLAAEPEVQAFLQARGQVEALLQEAGELERALAGEPASPAAADEEARRARDAAMLANLDALERSLKAESAPTQTRSPAAAPPAAPARLAAAGPSAEVLARRARLTELKARVAAQAAALAAPAVLRRTFTSHQEARRYFMACRPPRTRGWRCFAYDAIHDLPMHCAEPGKGGEWLVE